MALPAEVRYLADTYYQMTTSHAATTAAMVAALWDEIPFDLSLLEGWQGISEAVTETMAREQVASAITATAYLQAQATAQGFDLDSLPTAEAFRTPTDVSDYWLSYAVPVSIGAANRRGLPEVDARAAGKAMLIRTAGEMILDAGREAMQAGIVATPTIQGYYRKLRTPSCARCAVLAGKFYEHNEGFRRHPECDCEHIPAADLDDSLAFDAFEAIEAGQVTGLSEDDRKAILEDDADISQVINAKRGLKEVDIFGTRVQTTTTGTTRRGLAGNRLPRGTHRLTPREIYRQAGDDRDLARRLLSKHGYVF